MHMLRWPATGIALVCPICKSKLNTSDQMLVCGECAVSYFFGDGGVPFMLADLQGQESGETAVLKKDIMKMFTNYNRSLDESGFSRFSTFINWGFASEFNQAPASVNRNSIRLLQECLDGLYLEDKNILEVACGRGGGVRELCRSYGVRSVVGLDLTEANIAFCQLTNRFPNAYFCVGDAERLPIGSSCCDFVLNMEASDLYPSIKSFYDEVFRVLKPGGTFVYADDLPTWKFDDGERYLLELGFELLISRDITGEVLLSSDQVLKNRIAAFGTEDQMDTTIWKTMGVPGTSLYDEMKSGERQYKIMHFRKRAHHNV
ncbi:methyltransferase domain-containing protein [Paenibacillus sp. Lou8.1]|uniref:methyltransferase domain-containing protein n=1 Tax=Paenibacillus sp. Lou8.1 TaxID=2962041 RepID=UPI0020B82792|nr:methyltransferase domain-containing protein [Paenibacillus sp. Lou8.1]MCP3806177.1 methyltransferase domain-containing protein [Paenibacillus sp. Lou8.1]